MSNDPWTGARLGTMDDAPLGGLYLAEVVTELGPSTAPSFANAAARNTALTNWIAAGNTARPGMLAVTANDGRLWRYTGAGTTWEYLPSTPPVFATLAARNSYFSGAKAPIAGDRCICLGTHMVHDGLKWRFTLSGFFSSATDANGFISIPHGGGQAPVGWTIVPGYQSSDALNVIIGVLSSSNAGDGTVLGCRVTRNDTHTWLTGNIVSLTWMAQF